MVRIYLDLETFRPNENGAFVDEKIIAAGLLIDETPHHKSSLEKELSSLLIFSEWKGQDENGIISSIENYITNTFSQNKNTIVCGYNILRFDIPLLICKSIKNCNSDPQQTGRLWWDSITVDLQQQILPLNNNRFKGTNLGNILKYAKEKYGLKPPEYSESGEAIRELYLQKKYTEIEKHLKNDLIAVRWLDLRGIREFIHLSDTKKIPLFYELDRNP